MNRIVIVGAGHAGCQLAFALRDSGYQGAISLVNGEDALPYHRPPLSKGFLATGSRDQILLRAAHAFASREVCMVTDVAVEIRRERQELRMRSGAVLPYDRLVLATGTVHRRLDPSGDETGIHYLKSLADAEALRVGLARARRIAVVGAGFIGLEVTALAASRGVATCIIDAGRSLMSRTASDEVSAYFLRRHEEAGVTFRLGTRVARVLRHDGSVSGVVLTDGERLDTDLVIAGLGVTPNTELAEEAGLVVEDGIRVDAHLSTSDPSISAIGDCARFPTPYATAPVRLECIQNANDQARTLAGTLTGNRQPYAHLPWFWSDQGADKLQVVGLPGAADLRVLRGRPDDRRFSVFSFRDERLFSVESVNQPADHIAARRLIAANTPITPTMAMDPAIPLATHLAQPTSIS
jgi:3-phenylpropionate/trans-cinnamate dioxygenase ferredoxin reductase subunit